MPTSDPHSRPRRISGHARFVQTRPVERPRRSRSRPPAASAHRRRAGRRCSLEARSNERSRPWLQALRIPQWTKNLLVFAAPAAAGALGRPGIGARVCLTFVVFCLLASGIYLINDARDAADDRRHPIKRRRPIASGAIRARDAIAVGAGAVLLGVIGSSLVGEGVLVLAIGYALLNLSYTAWLRRIAVADIAAIAGAFVLRALAGAAASQVPISRWFILVVSFCALFVAAGKRYADLLDPAARSSRRVLEQYTADFLRLVLGVACAVSLGAYALWSFAAGATLGRELTIIPFTLALLRYGLLVTAGSGAAPERLLFGDRFMQLVGVIWLGMFGAAI